MDELDIRERGGLRNGEPQFSDRRLFMQLIAFGGSPSAGSIVEDLEDSGIDGVLYEDVNDPRGVGLLTWSDNPDYFVKCFREVLRGPAFSSLEQKLELSMLGRTYALGHEPNLED